MNMINVADLKDPATGKTYREINNAMTHAIPLWSLVEINQFDMSEPVNSEYNKHTGLRLFVCEQTRDCDGTPLYSLTYHNREDYLSWSDMKPSWMTPRLTGFSEDSLTVIRCLQSTYDLHQDR